jgi:hypothetical protein
LALAVPSATIGSVTVACKPEAGPWLLAAIVVPLAAFAGMAMLTLLNIQIYNAYRKREPCKALDGEDRT